MIQELHIENLAVREDATLEFTANDVALVGETGAGKSLVVSSLLLLRGERADYSLVRDKAKKASVSALFVPSQSFLSSHEERKEDLEDGILLLKRTLNPDKTSRYYINGSPVSLSERKEVTSHLIDIHSQASRYDLLDEGKQLSYLDKYGKEPLEKAKKAFDSAYQNYLKKKEEKETLISTHKERDRDYLAFQISEIEKYHIKEHEIEDLNAEYSSFREREERKRKYDDFLSSVENGNQSLTQTLQTCVNKLHPFLTSSYKEKAEQLISLANEREDSLSSFYDSFSNIEKNSARRDEINSRLFELKGLRRKYGKTTEEILSKYHTYQSRLKERDSYEELRKEKDEEIKNAKEKARKKAENLSLLRKESAGKREKNIGSEREALGLLKGGFKAELIPNELASNGLEHACFSVRLNKGLGFAPLKKAASGGEASRLRLALKVVLNALDPYDLLVLDEIDTGVSGKQASLRANKVKERSKITQVVLISHLPQALSSVDAAILISKKTKDGTTKTTAKSLTKEETILEIARRLSLENRTESALNQARVLYDSYHKEK